ncbi:MAG: hypothetical protein KF869_10020 [Phycisphaeraceae bacterium]|nr:hypothetical protein [Phycisphaeraceae bacterium]
MMQTCVRVLAFSAACCAAGWPGVLLAQSDATHPTTPPPSTAPQPANAPADRQPEKAAEPAKITDADQLLRALETADKDITTLTSAIRYTKKPNELVGGDDEVREGRLWFFARPSESAPPAENASSAAADPRPHRLFQIEFTRLSLGNTRRDDRRIWVFDGRWLVEMDFQTRFVHRREVVRPGEQADPLALGQGPLPIPIGQKREKIVERFEATLAPFSDGFDQDKAPPSLAETYQLHLKPRPGMQEGRDFREVRIWYRKSDLLPRLARAIHKDGSTTEVFLPDMQVNQDIPDTVFDTRTPPGWAEQIDDFRKAAADR